MINYLSKIAIFLAFGFFIIYSYYFSFPFHIESFNGYMPYIIIITIIYGVYKYLQVSFCKNFIVKFTPLKIFSLFLLHLFILSCLFFYLNKTNLVGGIILFVKIIFFSIIPILITIINIAFGKNILKKIFLHYKRLDFLNKETTFHFLGGLGIGFFAFIFLLTFFGILGLYNIRIVLCILSLFLYFGYQEIINLFKGFLDKKYTFDLKEGFYLKFISTEFLFLVSTLVLSVNLISIVRPFPIGWDDLGAYMNNPHLFAQAKSIIAFGGMYSRQLLTGIGYMLNSSTQAFFLNLVGGFLSFTVLILIVSDLFKGAKKTFINIPLLIGTFFISMPMIVFQQAKDMKLDTGLFFISIISVYMLYKTYIGFGNFEYKKNIPLSQSFSPSPHPNPLPKGEGVEQKRDNNKNDYKIFLYLLFIIGIISGFAFSIKFTSLLLISAIIGVMFFSSFGLFGFLGYIFIYFAIFTMGGLWARMNVVVNPNNIKNFEILFSIVSAGVGIGLLSAGIFLSNKEFMNKKLKPLIVHKPPVHLIVKDFFVKLGVFLLGILIALLPWFGKNIYVSYPDLSVGTILSGKSDSFKLDLSKIYSQEEIKNKELVIKNRRMSSSGTIANEDFGRYFGYEKGINNYIKLPWNLTMQKNQGGEFTDIGFLFLALLPVIFLFLPYKNKNIVINKVKYTIDVSYVVVLLLVMEIFIFKYNILTSFMSSFSLPLGYAFVLLAFLLPLVFFLFFLDDSKKLIGIFKLNLIFSGFYTFLWSISAFGIVWYGITMYFSFFIMIAIGAYYMMNYVFEKDCFNNLEKLNKVLQPLVHIFPSLQEGHFFKNLFKSIGANCFLLIFVIYFFFSVIPHGFSNLKVAGYKKYKLGEINKNEAPFLYHKEYLPILYHLNIKEDKRKNLISDSVVSNDIKKIIDKNKIGEDVVSVVGVLNNLIRSDKIPLKLKKDSKETINRIYKGILNPKKDYINDVGIYRIGTFLKYHIIGNNTRLLEDSLIFDFNDYIYNDDIDTTVSNIKKAGLKYLLVDLNAATIDRDSRHNLTNRYEKLLSTFRSDKLKLVDTDSMCLKVALEKYRKDSKKDDYMNIAGVNFNSYLDDGKVIQKGNKLMFCYNFIGSLMKNNKIDNKNYSFLMPYLQHVKKNNDKINTAEKLQSFLHSQFGRSFKVLFEVK